MYHGGSNRGSASLNLLGGLLDMPPESPAGTTGSFNIIVDNVSSTNLELRIVSLQYKLMLFELCRIEWVLVNISTMFVIEIGCTM